MSGDFPFTSKLVSPLKCIEKPWDLWISEIGHVSPRPDEEFAQPASVDAKGGASARRVHDAHPYKGAERAAGSARRPGLNRLKHGSMSLHGLLPQMDNLNAAVCHMCGEVVKCSAAYRHLLEYHTSTEPLLPPPPAPTVKVKYRKKETPPIPIDILPVKIESSPVHTATAPLSRIAHTQPELQYLDEASTSSAGAGEVQVCMQSGELPVVSIQDTEDLPLGENITDDIFAIMNSEGIQSADDITNSADWKNIIRDIGNMQDINFSQPSDSVQSQDLYSQVDTSSLSAYSISDPSLSSLQYAAPTASPLVSPALDTVVTVPTLPSTTPLTKHSRSKTSKSKFNTREYDPNKHCGVVTLDNAKPCTRSLTCKAHALSLRRAVEGRIKPFDTLLAEHRAARDPANAAAVVAAAVPAPSLPPLLVNTTLDLGFNGLTADQQVNDIYASLMGGDEGAGVLPELPPDLLLPDDAELQLPEPLPCQEEKPDEGPPPLVPTDVCWYASCPRPLALCTFNASHAGGAITLGKKFATVRSNIKSSLTRSSKSTGAANSYYYNQNSLSLSKSVHMNSGNKTNKPEVRKLIVTCSATGGGSKDSIGDLFEVSHTVNGHTLGHKPRPARHKRPSPTLLSDLGFSLLADEKC